MDVEDRFVVLCALLCEPSRARMLWNLLDGRAYTASELSLAAGISATSASNHLARLLGAGIVTVVSQGRNRYYSFSSPEVAFTVESLASLAAEDGKTVPAKPVAKIAGIRYCRSCYDHLAGYVGVRIREEMEVKGYLRTVHSEYVICPGGWEWVSILGIARGDFLKSRRKLTRKCLDWSERQPHLAGHFGAALLAAMLNKNWFRRSAYSRELMVTPTGKKALYEEFGLIL